MPLAQPPDAAQSLTAVPAQPMANRTLYRVWRHVGADGTPRANPWWFASAPDNPDDGGRFDLPSPMGTCYFATRAVGAVLEAFQADLQSLPLPELRARRLAHIPAPPDTPSAAQLTSRALAGRHGVSAALWAGGDRRLTQRWAAAFRRDGWWALYGGLQHDPSGQLRGYCLFDHAGDHPPTLGTGWTFDTTEPAIDRDLHRHLTRYGTVVREPGDLPFTTPPVPD